ncbi:hypothetical protein CHLNCDRAFT_58432 [Chlorella variabilis]|uniref:Protease Do-like PDZ domain-containing protein n=1 Tax=Chlorella variabilis TaxID=554065 RepID=E1ZK58_CHLVA|nr:hypothetical protein CHLNCDRAFT_58432 [Chlorella variabilis]EFN53636.1 hypothetical protein CHLNCDRAFT_58432 [Chlorella variabilis]|eukprot:XP_005845738.1 hypothetical protein CHLNCDRAFT_58432 [Chlorella variabilis]
MPPKRKGAAANGAEKALEPSPGSESGRRRAGAEPVGPSPQAAAEPLSGGGEQPGKKRRKERGIPGDGCTTSAAAGAADATGPPDDLMSPLSGPNSHEAAPTNRRTGDHLMEAVVKVFTVHSEPNFSLPWQRKRQFSSSGSGFVIAGRRLLTNAHCVDHHTQVKVKRRGSDTKYVAQVLAIGMECDIALLTVEDESFWQGLEAVHFGGLPLLQDSVTVIGYPIGGDTMSVTSGVVSRIEVTGYAHGAAELLGIQVDAAINSGNSGGPAFNDRGECVGIAFQSLKNEDTENISYIIPTPGGTPGWRAPGWLRGEFDFEAPVKLLDKMLHAQAENTTQQVVVLSQVLAADVNVGYEEVVNTQVLKVNGQAVNNLRDLVEAVAASTGQYLEFSLEYNQLIILDKAAAQAATADILTQHCIAHDRSEDLRAEAAAAAGPGAATPGGATADGAADGEQAAAAAGVKTEEGDGTAAAAATAERIKEEEEDGTASGMDVEAGAAEGGLPGSGATPKQPPPSPPPKGKPPSPPPPKRKPPSPPPPSPKRKPPSPPPKPPPPPPPKPPPNTKPRPPPRPPPTWGPVPPILLPNGSVIRSFQFSLCGTSDVPYAAYTAEDAAGKHGTAVVKLVGGRWVDAGSEGFTDAHGSRMSLSCFADGTPVFALADADGAFASTVFRLGAAGWRPVGPVGFYQSVFDTSVAVDGQGRPMVAFTNSKRQFRAAVMRFSGGAWGYAGSDGDAISKAFADSVELVVGPATGGPGVAGVPFLAYMDFGKNSADVEKLEGSGKWESVGGEEAITNGQLPHLAFAPDGTLYLAHLIHPVSTIRFMMVRQHNRTSDTWFEIGAARPAPDGFITALDIAVDARGVPCVAFNDGGDEYKVSVQCYKRSTNSWEYVANRYFSQGGSSYVTLDFDLTHNKPWVGYWSSLTTAASQPTVMRYTAYDSSLYT